MRARTFLTPLLTLAVLTLVTATPVRAGESRECPTSKAANDLLSCHHCQALKDLVTSANQGSIKLVVHEMQTGVLVRFHGKTPGDVEAIHRLVDRLWGAMEATAEQQVRYCKACQRRDEKLAAAIRDRALTDDGAIVVVSADDPEVLAWLRDDAQSQGALVRAASNR